MIGSSTLSFAQKAAAGRYPGKDPLFSNVRLLLRGDIAKDYSTDNRTITDSNITRTNAVAKWDTSAVYPNSAITSYQSPAYTSTLQLATGDFCIEGWIYKLSHTSTTGNQVFYQHGTAGATGMGIYLTTAGGIDFAANNTYFCGVPASTLALNTWYHVAVVKSSSTAAIFLNGKLNSNLAASNANPFIFAACSSNFNYTNAPRVGGSIFSNGSLRGYMDEFRVTVGVPRYLSNFQPQQRIFQGS